MKRGRLNLEGSEREKNRVGRRRELEAFQKLELEELKLIIESLLNE